VFNTRYEFICKEQEAALLQGVTLAELQQFYAAHLAPSSTQRRKLTIQVAPSRTAKGTKAGVKDVEQQQADAAAAAPHVQHEHGLVEPNSPGHASRHVVGAAVVHAGGSSAAAAQQNGSADASERDVDAAAAAGSPSARQLTAKRQRRQQEQPSEAAAAAAVGGVADAAALLPPGVQLQLVADPVQFKLGRERYPVYCTVQPQLTRKQ
jgi:hypothetical protein